MFDMREFICCIRVVKMVVIMNIEKMMFCMLVSDVLVLKKVKLMNKLVVMFSVNLVKM